MILHQCTLLNTQSYSHDTNQLLMLLEAYEVVPVEQCILSVKKWSDVLELICGQF